MRNVITITNGYDTVSVRIDKFALRKGKLESAAAYPSAVCFCVSTGSPKEKAQQYETLEEALEAAFAIAREQLGGK